MAKRNEETSPLSLKAKLFLGTLSGESSQVELCRRHNLSEDQLSKWKQQVVENVGSLFVSTEKQSSEAAERIAHLEQLVGWFTDDDASSVIIREVWQRLQDVDA